MSPIHNRNPTQNDRAAYEALRTLQNNEDDTTPCRAFAIVTEDETKGAFKRRYDVEKQSRGQCCVRRILGGQCKQGHRGQCDLHSIPHDDHSSLWLRDGKPAVYAAHLYDLPFEYATDIIDFCDENGLRADFDSGLSWYFRGRTTLVAVQAEE